MAEDDARGYPQQACERFLCLEKNLSFIYKQWEVKKSFQAGTGMLTLKDVSQANVRMDLVC